MNCHCDNQDCTYNKDFRCEADPDLVEVHVSEVVDSDVIFTCPYIRDNYRDRE